MMPELPYVLAGIVIGFSIAKVQVIFKEEKRYANRK